MRAPEIPADEQQRLRTLAALRILDTDAEERFDRITRLARGVFDVPYALVNLVGETQQWTKSQSGTEITHLPREESFCAHAILSDQTLVVPDLRADDRFADSPLVHRPPPMRFYAGRPLRARNGCALGSLCILDSTPRQLSTRELSMLDDLAVMVERELETFEMATIDELTGITNRRGFTALARHLLAKCRLDGAPATLVFVDLTRFKHINDTHGHAAGDQALKDFAHLMRETCRESDIFARMGGDEFLLLAARTDTQRAQHIVERLRRKVEAYNDSEHQPYQLQFNFGIEPVPPDDECTLEAVLARADERMYAHKRDRRA